MCVAPCLTTKLMRAFLQSEFVAPPRMSDLKTAAFPNSYAIIVRILTTAKFPYQARDALRISERTPIGTFRACCKENAETRAVRTDTAG